MGTFDKALRFLNNNKGEVDGLGPAINVLERLTAGHADVSSLHGVIERLPHMARIALALRGHPSANGELERTTRELEARFTNVRELQALRSYTAFGDALGAPNAMAYLNGTDNLEGVMEIPKFPEEQMAHFDDTLLVDQRILEGHDRSVGMVETCRLAGLVYGGNNETFVLRDPKLIRTGLYWCRFQNGRRNHGRKPSECRESFEKFEIGASAMLGIARYVQDDVVLWKHYMDCVESVLAADRDYCAVLGVWCGGPELRWYWDGDDAVPLCGSASAGSVDA
jgi:hypothetical protein